MAQLLPYHLSDTYSYSQVSGIDHTGSFRVKNRAAYSHHSNCCKNCPVVREKSCQCHGKSRHQYTKPHEPLTRASVCQPTENRLNDRGQK